MRLCGWPIASYGEIDYIIIKEKKFSNHKENGFKEPLHWFRGNSVAPSQIIYVDSLDTNTEKIILCQLWEMFLPQVEDPFII